MLPNASPVTYSYSPSFAFGLQKWSNGRRVVSGVIIGALALEEEQIEEFGILLRLTYKTRNINETIYGHFRRNEKIAYWWNDDQRLLYKAEEVSWVKKEIYQHTREASIDIIFFSIFVSFAFFVISVLNLAWKLDLVYILTSYWQNMTS